MNNIEEMKREQAEALKEALEQNAIFNEILTSLNMPLDTELSEHSYGGHAFVKVEVETLNEALVMAEKANPLNIYKCSSSCTSFMPEGSSEFENDDREKISIFAIFFFLKSPVRNPEIKKKVHGINPPINCVMK